MRFIPPNLDKIRKCPFCNEQDVDLTKHFLSHGTNKEEMQRAGYYASLLDELVAQVNALFIIRRDRWLDTFWDREINSYRYITNERRFLTDVDIKRHLKLKRSSRRNEANSFKPAIGVYNSEKVSKYLCFDIDGKEGWESAEPIAYGVVCALEAAGVNRKDIHVVFSGGKGFHVWLFFAKVLPVGKIEQFARFVTSWHAPGKVIIEFRGCNGLPIKLPLGCHYKTREFCPFMDIDSYEKIGHFADVPNSYEYFLCIEPMPVDVMLIDRVAATKVTIDEANEIIEKENPVPEIMHSKDAVARVYKEGLPAPGTRNQYIFLIALMLKDEGYRPEEVIDALIFFTDRENEAGRCEGSVKSTWADIKGTVLNVFEKDLHLHEMLQPLTTFERSILEYVPHETIYPTALTEKKRKTLANCLEFILQYAKIGRDRGGYFFLSDKALAHRLSVSDRYVRMCISDILPMGIIHRVFLGVSRRSWRKLNEEVIHEHALDALVPEIGINSLFFCPILSPLGIETLTHPVENEVMFQHVRAYTAMRLMLDVNDENRALRAIIQVLNPHIRDSEQDDQVKTVISIIKHYVKTPLPVLPLPILRCDLPIERLVNACLLLENRISNNEPYEIAMEQPVFEIWGCVLTELDFIERRMKID